MKKSLTIIIFLLLTATAVSQKEANIWYFGSYAGLDFNSGHPEFTMNGMFSSLGSSSTMSDMDGNFLFTTNGEKIWNHNQEVMLNGLNIQGNDHSGQGTLIVPKPGSENLYYVFTTTFTDNIGLNDLGLYYSVVDMNLDNGLGGVTEEKNVLLLDAWDAAEKIVACRKVNGEDIWVITRKFVEDGFAVYSLTSEGINTTAVVSAAINRSYDNVWGNMKISPDKKHLVAAYSTDQPGLFGSPDFEICNFNVLTGEVSFFFTLRHGSPSFYEEPDGVEFSPDSKLLYLSSFKESDPEGDYICQLYQYDMQFYEDSAQFDQSKILIDEGPCFGLQLATDGKIYTSSDGGVYYEYVSVINDPWKRGTACDFEVDAIDLESFEVGNFLPNILLDYLYRFEWEGQCQSSPFEFQNNFQPVPTNITWDFGDPDSGSENISHDLNPQHLFTHPGEFEVSVNVYYPSGRFEHTSRVITVEDVPHPSLGPGYTICEGDEVTLYAGDEEGLYAWSTGQWGHNLNQITVSDSGWYWVQVTQEIGCFGIDSV